MMAGRLDESAREVRAGLALDSMSSSNGWQFHRARLAALRGDLVEFEAASARAKAIGHTTVPSVKAIALARAGRSADARRELSQLPAATPLQQIAEVYANLGMPDSAVMFLERVVAHEGNILDVANTPFLIPLRSNPRYLALLKRLGFR
ncbi:MAG: hypothetical protein ABIV11_06505 [Gemmatimonadaceae bacterium]